VHEWCVHRCVFAVVTCPMRMSVCVFDVLSCCCMYAKVFALYVGASVFELT